MSDLRGRLNIELQRHDGHLRVTIHSSRPTATSRVFVGKTVEETAASLPALFSICTCAQACACASACEAAHGLAPSPGVDRLRRLLVDAETVKEHLWRILLDWPRFHGESPLEAAMSKAMGAWLRLRALLMPGTGPPQPAADVPKPDFSKATAAIDELTRPSAEQVLGVQPADWLGEIQTRKDLLAWAEDKDTAAARLVRQVEIRGWASAGRNQVSALPSLSAADLDPLLSGGDADRFAAEPTWQGAPRESSPFTRQREQSLVAALICDYGNGLLPRLAAQLLELASLQQSLHTRLRHLDEPVESLAVRTGDDLGVSLVPAARGLLVHRVAVRGGRIRDYRILAPTEWNFHPGGVMAQGLSALSSENRETLERQAHMLVTAVDPCVDYYLTIS